MIYTINESFFKKNTIPKEERERIINKYKDKKKIPDYSGIDKAAYILCKYKPSDLDKFCNSSDTKLVKNDLESRMRDSIHYDPEEVRDAKSLLNSIGSSNIAILYDKSLSDGSMVYHKDKKKILLPNNDELSYLIVSWEDFIDYVDEDLRSFDGYDVYMEDEEEE